MFARDTLVIGGGCRLEVVLVRLARLADDDDDDVDDDGREDEDELVFVVAKFATGGFTSLSDEREDEDELVFVVAKFATGGFHFQKIIL